MSRTHEKWSAKMNAEIDDVFARLNRQAQLSSPNLAWSRARWKEIKDVEEALAHNKAKPQEAYERFNRTGEVRSEDLKDLFRYINCQLQQRIRECDALLEQSRFPNQTRSPRRIVEGR